MEDKICKDCGCVIEEDEGFEVDGEWVCGDCLDRNYRVCADCGEIVSRDSVYYVHDRYGANIVVCDCCIDDYTCCDDCGEYYPNDTMLETADGNYICQDCRDDHYDRCENCGALYHTNDMIWNERHEAYYCQDCYAETDSSDSRIRDYHDNPRIQYFGNLEYGRQHYIGFELEIDRKCPDSYAEELLVDDLEDIAGDRLYYMHDGSLDYGFEIISQPHTMHELVNNLNLDKVLKACIDRGYTSHDAGTCGLHFHLSREMFGPEQYRNTAIQKMMLFYDNYYSDIAKVARRKDSQLHWCRRCSDEDNSKLNVKERAAKYKQLDNDNCSHSDRYKAVNTTNYYTVEIRIMRGTLNYETFMASLDFVYTIARNSRTISWKQSTDARMWLKGLKHSTIEYIKKQGAFAEYLQ